MGSANSKGGVFKLSCNFKLVHHPNGYRLPPNGGGAIGCWGLSAFSVWCAPDKSQWPMAPTGIGVGATVGVAMGLGAVPQCIVGVTAQIQWPVGGNGYRMVPNWGCCYGCWGLQTSMCGVPLQSHCTVAMTNGGNGYGCVWHWGCCYGA